MKHGKLCGHNFQKSRYVNRTLRGSCGDTGKFWF